MPTIEEFRALLTLIMASDPTPLNGSGDDLVKGWANRLARFFGFSDWVDAYHQLYQRDMGK